MRNVIKNILLEEFKSIYIEQEEPTSSPSVDESSDTVPTNSYSDGEMQLGTIRKSEFFKAVKLLTSKYTTEFFSSYAEPNDNIWLREEELLTTLKLIGISRMGFEGIINKLFWAAHDNFGGVKDGSISTYNQLRLRPFKEYMVPMKETVTLWKTVYWSPSVNAFSEDDAVASIIYDEDAQFESYEYENKSGKYGYREYVDEYDSDGKDMADEEITYRTIYPETGGDKRNVENDIEPLTEEIGPSPEENDIIDELEILVTSLGDTDCSSQLRELIKKYRNLPLNERYNKKNIRRN